MNGKQIVFFRVVLLLIIGIGILLVGLICIDERSKEPRLALSLKELTNSIHCASVRHLQLKPTRYLVSKSWTGAWCGVGRITLPDFKRRLNHHYNVIIYVDIHGDYLSNSISQNISSRMSDTKLDNRLQTALENSAGIAPNVPQE